MFWFGATPTPIYPFTVTVSVEALPSVVLPSTVKAPVVASVDPSNVSALPVAKALVDDAYTTPLAVNEVRLVPPLAVGRVPDTCVVNPILP